MRTMDPGALGGDDTSNVLFVAVMLVVTMGCILVFSALVGVIATGLDSKIDELRKGRSRVLEKDHTILLGWSEQVYIMLSELIEANASGGRPSPSSPTGTRSRWRTTYASVRPTRGPPR